jgi:DNA-binding response OmpR family regulator
MGIFDFFRKTAKKVILLVEDDVPLRTFIADRLRASDIDVLETGNGDEVLGIIEQHQPDGIVLDIMLPGKSGMEILAALREKDKKTPVVMLTTLSGEGGLKLEAVKQNAVFLNKADTSPDKVIETVLRHVLTGV